MGKKVIKYFIVVVLMILVSVLSFLIAKNKFLKSETNIQQYSVKYIDFDGTLLKEEFVQPNGTATAPSNPSRSGYEFIGWSKDFTTVTKDLVIIALYDVHKHEFVDGVCDCGESEPDENMLKVQFLDFDGTLLKEEFVQSNESATAPSNPSRSGYEFIGWSEDFTTVTKDLVIIALYDVHKHEFVDGVCDCGESEPDENMLKVQFLDFDGTLLKEEFVQSNESATAPSNPSRSGYEFIGWSEDFTTVTKDLVIIALYDVHEHEFVDGVCDCGESEPDENMLKVQFLDFDGTLLKEEFVQSNESATAPSNPSRSGYEFIGWSEDFTTVTKDLVIIALYDVHQHEFVDGDCWCGAKTVKSYVVIFKNYDGTILSEQTINENGTATAPEVPEREGYNYIGWDNEYNNITENITLTAQFSPKKYTITFDTLQGTKVDTQTVEFGDYVKIPSTPTKDGYVFVDWKLNSTSYNFSTPVSKDITLIASWEESPIKFILNEDGISYSIKGSINSQQISIPSTYGDLPVTSIKEYAFNGITKLTSIEIPNTLTYIGENAFSNTSNLSNVYYNGTLKDWFNIKFESASSNPMYYAKHFYMLNSDNEYYEVTEMRIPNNITSITYQMYGFENIVKIVIPTTIKSISETGFLHCNNLTEVYYNGTIENWCDIEFSRSEANPMYYAKHFYMFNSEYEYFELTKIDISETITSIGNYQFYGFENITEINIPNSISSIGQYAFSECNKVEKITLPFLGNDKADPTYTNFGYIFGATSYSNHKEYVPSTLHKVTLTSTTSIDTYAFANCSNLISIDLPNNLQKIGSHAFSNCTNLKYTEFENVKYLGSSENPYLVVIELLDKTLSNCEINKNAKIIMNNAFDSCELLQTIELPNGMISIGERAFFACSSLVSVTLPATICSIADYAFYLCNNLKDLYYSGNIETWCKIEFSNYASNPMAFCQRFNMINDDEWQEVLGIVIPNSITSINKYQFYGFVNITEFHLPSNLISIGESAFAECSTISMINIPDTTTSIDNKAFYNCVNLTSIQLSNNLESIGDWAFANCTALVKLTIPESVVQVGDEILANCNSLTSITIPYVYDTYFGDLFGQIHTGINYIYNVPTTLTSVVITGDTSLGSNVFKNCSSIENITFTNSIKHIYSSAFADCGSLTTVYYMGTLEDWCNIEFGDSESNPMCYASDLYVQNDEGIYYLLTDIVIPNSINKIGNYQFYNIKSISNVVLHNNVTSIGAYAFGKCGSLYKINMSENISVIGNGAFYYCELLEEIKIPISVEYIYEYTFYYCKNLTDVSIQGNIKEIRDYAFEYCYSLENIEIPNTVSLIGNNAFYGCDTLTEVTIPSSVITMGQYAFAYCDNLIIYCEVAQKPNGWNNRWATSSKGVVWDTTN